MSADPAIIELVDAEILAVGAGATIRAPGYAMLADNGVDTGESALAQAWLYPQRSFNQYWRQLTLAPLPVTHRHARHYADLAFAQLKSLHQELGAPEEVVFLLPGSFTKDQLSILLGLANALPVNTVAMVDAAVAAATADTEAGDLVHVDLQLHQAVVTHLRGDSAITRVSVDVIPDVGIAAFYRSYAQWIAEQFIAEYRYDPLHLAESEQQLYNLLPGWLAEIEQRGQHTAELATAKGNFRVNLSRSSLDSQARPRAQRLLDALTSAGGGRVGSYRFNKLPGLARVLELQVLAAQQGIDACRASMALFREQGGSVPYVTELPRANERKVSETSPAETGPAQEVLSPRKAVASHVLYGHKAIAIAQGLGISVAENGLVFTRDGNADLWLSSVDGVVATRNSSERPLKTTSEPDRLCAGDTLEFNGEILDLIEVTPEP